MLILSVSLLFYCELFSLPIYDVVDEGILTALGLAFVTIFLFKKRSIQITMTWLLIIINVLLIAFMAFVLLTFSGEGIPSEKGIGMFFLLLNLVLLFSTKRAIKKDEDLVKSVDRFR